MTRAFCPTSVFCGYYNRFREEIEAAHDPEDSRALRNYCDAVANGLSKALAMVCEDPVYGALGLYGKISFGSSSLLRFLVTQENGASWQDVKSSVFLEDKGATLIGLLESSGYEDAILVIVGLHYLLQNTVAFELEFPYLPVGRKAAVEDEDVVLELGREPLGFFGDDRYEEEMR